MILCSIANREGEFLSAFFVICVVRIWRDHHFYNAANTCPLSLWNCIFIYESHFLLLYRLHYLTNVQYFLILRDFLSFRLLTTCHICITSYKLCLFEEFVLLPDRGHKWTRYDTKPQLARLVFAYILWRNVLQVLSARGSFIYQPYAK